MQACDVVPLHAEEILAGRRGVRLRFRLRRLVERPLACVFLQRHGGLRIYSRIMADDSMTYWMDGGDFGGGGDFGDGGDDGGNGFDDDQDDQGEDDQGDDDQGDDNPDDDD